MSAPLIAVASWVDGLFVGSSEPLAHELEGRSVRALASDGRGGALAIIDGRELAQRDAHGAWTTLAHTPVDVSCCVTAGGIIYLGSDDAQVLRVTARGTIEPLRGLEATPGRERWYAGTAVIDGKVVGPPLGIRSLAATTDGTLLANVHVGGIPRSTDGGETWQPTIAIDADVHEVCAHSTRSAIVAAAAATGLCLSTDGGVTWRIEQAGLDATYCSAVAFAGGDVLVAASAGHFAEHGAIYRVNVDRVAAAVPVKGGLPRWLEGIADTRCIAARDSYVAVADGGGNLYVSADAGRSWQRRARSLPRPSAVLIV